MSFTKTFWLVWSPEGKTPPARTYDSKAQAVSIAKDMTTKHPGQRFFALEAVAGFVSKVQLDELLVHSPPPRPAPELSKPFGYHDGGTYTARWVVDTAKPPAEVHVGSTYTSQKGSSRIVELRNVDGRIAIVVYKPEDRPLVWKEARWATHLGEWWTPEKLRLDDPLLAHGRIPPPSSPPALYVLP